MEIKAGNKQMKKDFKPESLKTKEITSSKIQRTYLTYLGLNMIIVKRKDPTQIRYKK